MLRGSSSIAEVALRKSTYGRPMRFPGGGSWLRELTRREPLSASTDTLIVGGTGELEPLAVPIVRVGPRGHRLQAVLVTIRPRQWIKNGLVVGAAGAAGALGHDDVPVRVALACVAFCLLASGIYAVNDVCDAPEDRRHPRKRHRPVAAGELDPRAALALGGAMMLSGLGLCALVRWPLLIVGGGYLALTLSYTLFWRQVAILDVLAIAGGFVLRAIAGGEAAPVALSRWFVLVVTFVAVFVAAGKRQAELRRTAGTGVSGRRALKLYTPARLRAIVAGSSFAALFAYCVWAFELPEVHGIPWRPLTIVPFAACLARYAALVRAGGGEAPEDALLRDRYLQAAALAWLLLFALGVHAAG